MSTIVPTKPLWRRILRQGVTLVCTLLVVGLAVGLIITAQSGLAQRAAEVIAPQETLPMQVATAQLRLENGYKVTRRFPGQIEAAQRTTMAFEQGGTLALLAVDEGDTLAAGALIARLDTRLISAEHTRLTAVRRALEAQAELARRTTERQTELKDRGFASKQAVDNVALRLTELEARIAEIDASLVSITLQLEKSELRAPFEATVSTRLVDTGGAVGAGQAILSLVETDGQQFRVGLTPGMVTALSEQTEFQVIFDGDAFELAFDSILPELDSATRTRTVLFNIAGDDLPPLRDTGMLVMKQHVVERGAWVPLGALQDAPRGLWRLMTVKDSTPATVQNEAVEVLFSDGERAYVRGTFVEGTRYITDGPHRVVKGQSIRILDETS
ncbi:MAG: efflux RND transporter periplasmic adaptor subunit [Paracoccaceae bacterium]|nr:efflux RND transporter periplasmic adaptor subunit [Paracoccaceae bacterium]